MPNRQCGECNACCIALPILELNKPRQVPCKHLCAAGCSIYRSPEKPAICSTWRCEWLNGHVADHYRPDKLGLMFWFRNPSLLIVTELWDGAIDLNKDRMEALILRISQRRVKTTGRSFDVCFIPASQNGTGLPGDGYVDRVVKKEGHFWLDYVDEPHVGTV